VKLSSLRGGDSRPSTALAAAAPAQPLARGRSAAPRAGGARGEVIQRCCEARPRAHRHSPPGTQAQRRAEDDHRARAARAGRRGHGLRGGRGRALGRLQAPLLRDGGRVDGCAALAGEQEGDDCEGQAGHLSLAAAGRDCGPTGQLCANLVKAWEAKGLSQNGYGNYPGP